MLGIAYNEHIALQSWRRTNHGPGVFPLGQLVQDSQQVDARKQISPTELVAVSCFLKAHTHTSTPKSSLEEEMLRFLLHFIL